MIITEIIWLDHIEEKIIRKHGIQPAEVEEILLNKPRIRFIEKGFQEGQDVYAAMGQTDNGRYILVIFILKSFQQALLITARSMTRKEIRSYGKRK